MQLFTPRRDPADVVGHDQETEPATPSGADVRYTKPKDALQAVAVEILAELRLARDIRTAEAARRNSQLLNDVLEVGSFIIPADGILIRSYQTGVGSIVVANASGFTVTVQAGTTSSSAAPTSGRGVQVIPNNSWLGIPIGAHAFTIFGTPGTTVSIQAYTSMYGIGAR